MIQYRDFKRFAGFQQFFGESDVVIAGLQIVGWVVVCQNKGRGVMVQCQLEDFLGINYRAGHTTPADVQLPDDFVGSVQQDYEKGLIIVVGKVGKQQLINIATGFNFDLLQHPFGYAALAQFHGCNNADGFGFAHSAIAGKVPRCSVWRTL